MTDLLCADPWCCNAGDVATSLATANGLAERGVPVRRVSSFQGNRTIIGGGDLVGEHAHGHIYRVPGSHILNAVGVRSEPGDLSYLQDYQLLSARDHVAAERITDQVDRPVDVVPCPATLIQPAPWELACSVPRWGLLQHLGDYVVIHARPELSGFANGARNMQVIAIEPAPYTWTPWESHGWLLPATHSPELIAAVLSRAKAVITLSLHMSILALAVGTPFCCPNRGNDQQQEKLRNYWTRSGIPEVIYAGTHPVQHARSLAARQREVRHSEILAANEHLDHIAKIIVPQ